MIRKNGLSKTVTKRIPNLTISGFIGDVHVLYWNILPQESLLASRNSPSRGQTQETSFVKDKRQKWEHTSVCLSQGLYPVIKTIEKTPSHSREKMKWDIHGYQQWNFAWCKKIVKRLIYTAGKPSFNGERKYHFGHVICNSNLVVNFEYWLPSIYHKIRPSVQSVGGWTKNKLQQNLYWYQIIQKNTLNNRKKVP